MTLQFALSHSFDIGRRQIDFIDDWNNFQVALEGQMNVCQTLGLNTLGRINDQKAPSQAESERDTS